MPIVKTNNNEFRPRGQLPAMPERPATSFIEAFGASLSLDQSILNLTSEIYTGGFYRNYIAPIDDDFDFADHIPKGYEGNAIAFSYANNLSDIYRIQTQIDMRAENEQIVANAGAPGVAARFAAGVIDPVFMIPVGGAATKAVQSGKYLQGGLATAKAGLLGSTASEVILQATTADRTLEESAWNVGLNTFFSGVLGTTIPIFAKGAGLGTDEATAIAKKGYEQLINPDLPQSGGAAAAPKTTLAQETLTGTLGAGRVLRGLTPYQRLINAPFTEARRIVQELNPSNLLTEKNLEGIASPFSVQQYIDRWNIPLADSIKNLDGMFTKYRTGNAKGRLASDYIAARDLLRKKTLRKDGTLTRGEFYQEVGRALHRGEHEIPEVLEAAQFIKKNYFEQVKNRLVQAGIFDENIHGNIDNYFKVAYDAEKITARPQDFEDIVFNAYVKRREDAKARLAPQKQEIEAMRTDIRQQKFEIEQVQSAVGKATFDATLKNAIEAIDEITENIPTLLPENIAATADDAAKKATKVSAAKQRSVFKKELKKATEKLAKEAAEKSKPLTIKNVVDDLDDVLEEDVFDFVLQETPPPIGDDVAKATSEGTLQQLEVIKNAAEAEAKKAYAEALKKIKSANAAGETFEQFQKRIRKQIEQAARKAANAARKEAQKKATELYKTRLKESVKKLNDIAKQRRGDLALVDVEDYYLRLSAQRTVTRITADGIEGKLPYDMADEAMGRGKAPGAGLAGSLKTRVLFDDLNFEDVSEFLILDAERVMQMYHRTVVPQMEMTAYFGDVNMANRIRDLTNEYEALRATVKSEKEAVALKKAYDASVNDITAVRDIILNNYKLPENPNSVFIRSARALRAVNLLRAMGDVVGSSIPDIMRIANEQGIGNTIKHGLVPMIRNFKKFNINKKEAGRMAAITEMILDSRMRNVSEITGMYNRGTMLERGIGGLTDTYGIVSLISPWNSMLKHSVARVAEGRIFEQSVKWANGKISKKNIARLANSGIDKSMARRIAEQLQKHGEQIDGTWYLNGWDETPDAMKVREALGLALQKEINTTIVTPYAADKPLWMSTEVGKSIGQFKSFMFASASTVTMSNLQRRDANSLFSLIMMTGMGSLVYAYKTIASGRELSDDPRVWAKEGIDRSGILSIFMDVNNMLERGAGIGLAQALGTPVSSRYAQRNAWDALAGPSFGLVKDMGGILANTASGDSEQVIKSLRRMAPYQNHFALRHLYDAGQKAATDFFGDLN